jgi:hypothetical protein
MLIARPYGERDAAYRAVARPLFQKLEAVAGKVEVDLVRPPTLDMLRSLLKTAKERGEPYHILHFDGHGTFGRGDGGEPDPQLFKQGAAKGFLAFEQVTGGAELVAAEDVAAAPVCASRVATAASGPAPPGWRRRARRPSWRWATRSMSVPLPSSWRRSTRRCSRARR